MTKIQLHYELTRPVDDEMMDQIARVHGVYGIIRVALADSMDTLTIDYDATRLNPSEVETVLRKAGLPVAIRV